MSLEGWKSFFEIGGVILLFLTFIFGAGVVITGNWINERQAERLRQFDSSLTEAKTDLLKQQERAANAERNAADAKKTASEAGEGTAKALADAAKAQASLGSAERKAAEANSKAEGFRLDIAKANESAKQAEARAAEAALELERFKAPRTLTGTQQTSIAALLRPLGSVQVEFIIIGDAPEIGTFTEQIASAIRQGGWTVRTIVKAVSGPNVSGVLVGTKVGSSTGIGAAASTLILALRAQGIVAGSFTPQYTDQITIAVMGDWAGTTAPIRLLVAAKP